MYGSRNRSQRKEVICGINLFAIGGGGGLRLIQSPVNQLLSCTKFILRLTGYKLNRGD